MSGPRTPGMMFVVNQGFPSLRWRVVPVPEAQGLAMRGRECPHVYDTSAQAYAIAQRLNLRRKNFLECDGEDLGLGCDCGQVHEQVYCTGCHHRVYESHNCSPNRGKEVSSEPRTVGGGSSGAYAPVPAAVPTAVPPGAPGGDRTQRAQQDGSSSKEEKNDTHFERDRAVRRELCRQLKNRMAEAHQDDYGDFDLEDIYRVINQVQQSWEER